jgi:hypothetical protein
MRTVLEWRVVQSTAGLLFQIGRGECQHGGWWLNKPQQTT